MLSTYSVLFLIRGIDILYVVMSVSNDQHWILSGHLLTCVIPHANRRFKTVAGAPRVISPSCTAGYMVSHNLMEFP